MSNEQWTAVDDYINNLFVRQDAALEAALATSDAAGLPEISVTASQGKLLYLLARIHGARTVLELGTLGGYSTIWLARALPRDGRLITLESESKHAEVAGQNIARAGLSHIVEIRLGPALETLPKIATEGLGPFDLIFIDADKPAYPDYFEWAMKLSRPGTVIIADNLVRDGKIIEADSDDESVRGARRFNELVAGDPRLTATMIQTVGSKGYDGFAIAIVNQ